MISQPVSFEIPVHYVAPLPDALSGDVLGVFDGIVSMDYKFYEVECIDRFLNMKAEEAKRGAFPEAESGYIVAAISYFVVVAPTATEWEKGEIAGRFRQHLSSKPLWHSFACLHMG